jgi:hypothetical protein
MNIVLDFDRTLFDTKLFNEWLADEIAIRSGRSVGEVLKQAEEQFYIYNGDLYYYDIPGQILAVFGNEAAKQLEAIKKKALAHQSFIFSDVQRTLARLQERGKLTILTYGNDAAQQFKLSLCPQLAGIPVIIVQTPKGPHLATNFDSNERCVFVDDKDQHGELPDWVEFYHLRRDLEATDLTGVVCNFDQLLGRINNA